ncbi:hypothetical protein Halha_0484 [Halobacteroides halobius DSM 5150]|uniref:P pilus assembly/Cpx signaling pathway, periplasmic inhibitor/zinc-resistance associated protein n=1 Tax=Halobacteroides halobius (strain ATCC 35273 / DSM 5150 / MD-1) TaxID=748449 RepID=L0K7E2_HALHC|nr:periplasmic heavy metal sensor [Halobacteroides halobius]AGB40460.1 hypothetical protein Halha_0484 [Halobacteroides halobius DSM 5150]
MKKFLRFAVVMTLVLGVSVYAFAHGGGSNFNQINKNNDYPQDLNLSDEQLDSINHLRDEYQDKMHDLMDDIVDKNDNSRDLYFNKNVKRNEIIEAEKEVNQLRNKMYKLMTEMQLKIRDMMSSEQLEIMEDYGMMNFGGIMGQGRGGRVRGHMGGYGMMGGYMMNGNNGMMGMVIIKIKRLLKSRF